MKHLQLIGSAVALIVVMLFFVPWATRTMGTANGYLAVMLVYWFAFCLPLGLWFTRGHLRDLVSLKVEGRPWVPALVIGLAAVALAVVTSDPPEGVTPLVIALAMGMGAINGPVEELYWRGAWLAQAGDRLLLFLLGLALFALWHVPLALAHGMDYQGGPLALIGGSLGLGAIWTLIAWKTRRIGWTMLSHAAINMIVFNELAATISSDVWQATLAFN